MKKLKKTLTVTFLGLLVAVGVVYTAWPAMTGGGDFVEAMVGKYEEAPKLTYAPTILTNDENRDEVMKDMHYMTHSKIMAEDNEKWGFIPMTQENINHLISSMYKDKDSYNQEDYEYLNEALQAWKKGDFSNAVDVHNYIWSSQGGTIGQAERLATPDEEQHFLDTQGYTKYQRKQEGK